MTDFKDSRRGFLKGAGMLAGAALLSPKESAQAAGKMLGQEESEEMARRVPADYTVIIETTAVEIAPKRIVSMTTYNGQFPGPLLRFREGRQVTVDIINRTRHPEQLHWHGQFVPDSVDGTVEEGTPFIPPKRGAQEGRRRIVFTPRPAGFRFYHSHIRAGANLSLGTYGGQVGPVYIEPRNEPGNYDREIFLTLKEFEPSFSHGGDRDFHFLRPANRAPSLVSMGETAMKASLAKGMPLGYEVGYNAFTINGRMLGHGEPIRVKQGERVLFRILNGSATEIRSLHLPGHSFEVVALDGNPVPNPAKVPVVWLGVAERVSAIVEMNHPGVWVMGDTFDSDRHNGMGIVVEYANRTGEPRWVTPPPSTWDYARFAKPGATAPEPDETFHMLYQKDNAAYGGFNKWTINGVAFPHTGEMVLPTFHLREGRRYRVRVHNATDDVHPIHLHRHTFELTELAGVKTAGVRKDVFMLGGYHESAFDFVADDPGLTLFHCHQQIHMDYGFMTLFNYV